MGNNNLESKNGETPEPKPKASAFSLSPEPVVFGTPEEDPHKFEAAPEREGNGESAPVAPAFEDLGELPTTYHEDVLFLVARDPRWLFSYWDFDWARYPSQSMRGGSRQFFLKIYTGSGAEESVVEIKPEARNWYVPVNSGGSAHFAEIGFYNTQGEWEGVVRSAIVMTPAEEVAHEEAAAFATLPAHLTFEQMLDLLKDRMAEGESLIAALARVAGEGQVEFRAGAAPTWTEDQKRLLAALLGDTLVDKLGLGSDELDQLLRKQLSEKLQGDLSSLGLSSAGFAPGGHSLFSGIGASWSAQPFSIHAERGFYMHVNAEIIFYGGTHPDAAVTVDGKPIQLSADGTFRYHFTLPDGDFAIPIVARSPDGVEQRSATLSFVRSTEKSGKVDDTGQPGDLGPLIGRK